VRKENEVSKSVIIDGQVAHVATPLHKVKLWKTNNQRMEKGYLVDFRSCEDK